MSSLMVDYIVSLDGYGAAEGWPGWWGMEGPEYFTWLEEDGKNAYTTLMGATTYQVMSEFAQQGKEGVDALTTLDKVVFSSSLKEPLSWANTELVTRDAIEAVREMKRSKDLRTLGSLSLSRSLLRAGLVDRFRVVIFPVITGSTGQDRIFDGYPDVKLDLVESRTLDGRSQMLDYVPTVLTEPPGTGSQ